MKNAVTNGFDKMTISNLLAKAANRQSGVGGHAEYFPQPDPSLSDVQAAICDFRNAAFKAQHGDRVAIAFRNQVKEQLVTLLRKLGSYVNLVANGNLTIAISSGFDVARDKNTPLPPITIVKAPKIMPGVNAGELIAKGNAIKGARIYQYLLSTDSELPLHQWTMHCSTRSKYYLSGLESGTRYYIRRAVVAANNQLVYSEPTSMIVL